MTVPPTPPLFRLPAATSLDPRVAAWFDEGGDELRRLARFWFDQMRACGPDVRELLHDGRPTACVEDAAFAYVDAFKGHVNVGFFNGAGLADPAKLLTGDGKAMRRAKLSWGAAVDATALRDLILASYLDVKSRSPKGEAV